MFNDITLPRRLCTVVQFCSLAKDPRRVQHFGTLYVILKELRHGDNIPLWYTKYFSKGK